LVFVLFSIAEEENPLLSVVLLLIHWDFS